MLRTHLALLLLFAVSPAWAGVLSANFILTTGGSPQYSFGPGASTTESNGSGVVPFAATLSDLHCTATALGASAVVTIRIRTAAFATPNTFGDGALTCTITGPALSCVDTNSGHNMSVAAGDALNFKYTVDSGSPEAGRLSCSVRAS